MGKKVIGLLFVCFVAFSSTVSGQSYSVQVDAQQSLGKYKQFWGGLGQESFDHGVLAPASVTYFEMLKEANSHGREVFNYFSCKCMFSDRKAANHEQIGGYVYVEDQNGQVSYDWSIVDKHFDAILGYGLTPIVNFSFMPEKLASDPNKTNPWQNNPVSPPKDHNKWKNLVYETVNHLKARYGASEIEKWYFEVWNEPDLDEFFWIPHPDQVNYKDRGDNQAYFKLYDYSAEGALAAHSGIKIGGPAIAGDIELFIMDWYPHCISGTNYATGTTGSRVDFVSRHNYGTADWIRKRMETFADLAINQGKGLLDNDPMIIITENGPTPYLNQWLNTRYVAAWLAKEIDMIFQMGDEKGQNYMPDILCFWTLPLPQNYKSHFGLATVLGNTWSPIADAVIKRPVFNSFEALSWLGEERVGISGTQYGSPVNAIATKTGSRSVEVLLYHLNDEDYDNNLSGEYTVNLRVNNIPFKKGYIRLFKIDETHSNSYTVWKSMGRPEVPTSEQLSKLKAQDDLQLFEPVQQIAIQNGSYSKNITMQNNSVALVLITADNPGVVDTTPPDPPTGLEVIDE